MSESHTQPPLKKLLAYVRGVRRDLLRANGQSSPYSRALFFTILFSSVLRVRRGESLDLSRIASLSEEMVALCGAVPFSDVGVDKVREEVLPLDPEIVRLIDNDPIALGWAYQFWNEAERDGSTWAISRRGTHEAVTSISAATQIFTEDYMASFLVKRCIAAFQGGESSAISSVLDPACGTGHILAHVVRAFAADSKMDPDQIASVLSGCDIDPHAVEVCRAVLLLELSRVSRMPLDEIWANLLKRVRPLNFEFGTLNRSGEEGILHRNHACVITNPPYIGRRKMSAEMRAFLEREYPDTGVDLCAAFVERCIELTTDGGMLGLVTVDKWLRLKGYEALRTGGRRFRGIYHVLSLDTVCELGPRAFHSWSSLHDGVGAALLTARREPPSAAHSFRFVSCSELKTPNEKAEHVTKVLLGSGGGQHYVQRELCGKGASTEFVVNDGLPQSLVTARRTVGREASVVVGLQTNDDRRFVRYVWSVPPDKERWRVHAKGGGYGRWYGLNRYLLDWREGRPVFEGDPACGLNAERWFAREGWTYTWFANGALGLRRKDEGWSFGRAASSGLFCEDLRLVAYLNSRVASLAVRRRGGKAQLPEGVVRSLPIPDDLEGIDPSLVDRAVELKRLLVETDFTDATFRPGQGPDPKRALCLQAILLAVEGALESQVVASLSMSDGERRSLDEAMGTPVGWYTRDNASVEKEIWSVVPSHFAPVQSVVGGSRAPLPNRPAGSRRVADYFSVRAKVVHGPRALPALSLLEDVCRFARLHPFDAVSELLELLDSDSRVRRDVLKPAVCDYLVEQALTSLGHQWWSTSTCYNPSLHVVRTSNEIADYIAARPVIPELESIVEQDLADWISSSLGDYQRKAMRDVPLIVSAKGCGSAPIRFSHRWCASNEEIALPARAAC